MGWRRSQALRAALVLGAVCWAAASALAGPAELSQRYQDEVDRRLAVPADEAQRYGELAGSALAAAGISLTSAEYVVVIDRSPYVQALFLYWLSPGFPAWLVGASPVSTGRGGAFDHFETPLGVFEHGTANPDFRAEGTRNVNGIRGYGAKGLRVFDLGWQQARRLWGTGGISTMRLQMHATDAERLEPRLGSPQSKGCIRIPASLNHLLDRFGVLDADYLNVTEGAASWVLAPDRTPLADAGRWVIVVETERTERPPWSPGPAGEASP